MVENTVGCGISDFTAQSATVNLNTLAGGVFGDNLQGVFARNYAVNVGERVSGASFLLEEVKCQFVGRCAETHVYDSTALLVGSNLIACGSSQFGGVLLRSVEGLPFASGFRRTVLALFVSECGFTP